MASEDRVDASIGPPTDLEQTLAARPETRLLLAAAGPAQADLGPAVAAAVADGLDADAFFRLVRSHRVVPHVASALADVAGVPDGLRARLLRAERSNAHRQLAMTAALGDVLRALGDAGVPSLPLKGPTLARWLFGDVARRSGIDLDVLVAPPELGDAIAAIETVGYRAGGKVRALTAAQATVAAAEYQIKDAVFQNDARRVSLELHWRPFRDPRLTAIRTALEAGLVTDRADPMRPDLGPPAAVAAFVLIHGALHGYRRLTWLTDVAGLAGRLSDDDWAEALAIGQADGVEGAILLGPTLANRLLGVPVPAPLRARVHDRRRTLRRLVGWCQTDDPDDLGRTGPIVLARTVGLYDTAGARTRRVWSYLVDPSGGELVGADLDGARWRRRLARPFRLATNAGRWALGRRAAD